MTTTPVQTAEQTAASGPVSSAIGHLPSTLCDRTKITYGDLAIFKRSAAPNSAYSIRIQSQGKRQMRKLLRTAEESFKKARQSVKKSVFSTVSIK